MVEPRIENLIHAQRQPAILNDRLVAGHDPWATHTHLYHAFGTVKFRFADCEQKGDAHTYNGNHGHQTPFVPKHSDYGSQRKCN